MDTTVLLTAILLPILYIVSEAWKAHKQGEIFRPVEFVKSIVIILITAGFFSQVLGQLIMQVLELEIIIDGITFLWTLVLDKLANNATRTYPLAMKSAT